VFLEGSCKGFAPPGQRCFALDIDPLGEEYCVIFTPRKMSTNLLIKPIYYGTYKITDGIVVFRHDDASTDSWALYALPIYLKYGIAATFFTNTRDVIDNGQQAVDYAKLLILNGMEVASHFSRHCDLNHYDPSNPYNNTVGQPMPESELRRFLQEAVDDITSWGGARNGKVESNVTPWQEWNNLAQQVIPQYHTSSSHTSSGPMSYPPADYMDCTSFIVENTTTVAQVQAVIQDCIDNRKFVQLMFHYIEHDDGTKTQGSGQYTWLDSQLEQLCAWCAQQRSAGKKIIFPQMRDATRYMQGLRDYGYSVAAIWIELGLLRPRVFPFIRIAFHVYNSTGEEILLSSVFSFRRSGKATRK
jgi:hypothetical protein